MNKKSDRELVTEALQGSQVAFTQLMERHKSGLLQHICENLAAFKNSGVYRAEEPEDICMEVFQKVFLNIGSYNPNYEFSTWLYNIATNRAIDYHRRRKIVIESGLTSTSEGSLINYGTGDKNSPEDKLISNQEYSLLLKRIEELDEKYREIAKMRFISEYAYDEIAAKLNIPLNTVKTRLKRAKEILAKKMI